MFFNSTSKKKAKSNLKIEKGLNKVYLCQNSDCERKYVRFWEVLHFLRKGLAHENLSYLLSSSAMRSIETEWSQVSRAGEEELALIKENYNLCPTCKGGLKKETSYSWLDTLEEPYFIKVEDWNFLEESIDRELESFRSKLNELEKSIKEYKDIKAFQSHYELTIPSSNDGRRFKEIEKQLSIMADNTEYESVKARVFFLIEDIKELR